jgi:hypothetical protein
MERAGLLSGPEQVQFKTRPLVFGCNGFLLSQLLHLKKIILNCCSEIFFFFALGAIRKLVKEMDLGAAFREVSSVKVWESKGLSYLNIRF